MSAHHYAVRLDWTGARGAGTTDYRAYGREHVLRAPGKPDIAGSADPHFRGDAAAWNPEELLVGALSACHMLWFLHLAADAGVVVTAYADAAEGVMTMAPDGGGRFERVTLRPAVATRAPIDPARLAALHAAAHAKCFIAASVNFPVTVAAHVDGR